MELSASVSNPFTNEVFDLRFDRVLYEHWQKYPGLNVQLEWTELEAPPESLLFAVNVDLAALTKTRVMSSGRIDPLGAARVTLHLEDADDFSELELHESGLDSDRPQHPSGRWGRHVARAIQTMVDTLFDGSFPPASPPLRPTRPACTAEALVRDGRAVGGHELYAPFVDDWWAHGTRLDVPRLAAAIEAGAIRDRHARRWCLVPMQGGRTRLVFPLLSEVVEVRLTHLDAPLWLVHRYFLALDVDPRGTLDYVSIRSDSADRADEDERIADTLFADRLSEEGYLPITDLLETFVLREEAVETP